MHFWRVASIQFDDLIICGLACNMLFVTELNLFKLHTVTCKINQAAARIHCKLQCIMAIKCLTKLSMSVCVISSSYLTYRGRAGGPPGKYLYPGLKNLNPPLPIVYIAIPIHISILCWLPVYVMKNYNWTRIYCIHTHTANEMSN